MIRKAIIEDAKKLSQLIHEVENESSYMLYEPGERKPSVEKQRNIIERLAGQDNSAIFLAEKDDRLIGYLFAIGGDTARTKHSAYLVVGILSAYRGIGIGTALFSKLDNWARQQNLRRLELTVVTKNVAGVSLYKKSGFEVEGVKKDSLLIDGEYHDEYYMAKIYE